MSSVASCLGVETQTRGRADIGHCRSIQRGLGTRHGVGNHGGSLCSLAHGQIRDLLLQDLPAD